LLINILNKYHTILYKGVVGCNRLKSGQRAWPTGTQVEERAVEWTFDTELVGVKLAATQRSIGVRTGVVEGIEGALGVEKGNPAPTKLEGAYTALGEFTEGGKLNGWHSFASTDAPVRMGSMRKAMPFQKLLWEDMACS